MVATFDFATPSMKVRLPQLDERDVYSTSNTSGAEGNKKIEAELFYKLLACVRVCCLSAPFVISYIIGPPFTHARSHNMMSINRLSLRPSGSFIQFLRINNFF